MCGAESVVDVVVGKIGQLFRELLVIRFFFGVKAQVFKQQGLAFFQFAGHFFGFNAYAIGAKADVFAGRQFFVKHHSQALGHRLKTHPGIGLALGAAEMRGENEPRAVAQCVLDGGQGLADARIVHNQTVIEGDVEVHTRQDAVAIQRKVTDGKFGHDGYLRECSATLPAALATDALAVPTRQDARTKAGKACVLSRAGGMHCATDGITGPCCPDN